MKKIKLILLLITLTALSYLSLNGFSVNKKQLLKSPEKQEDLNKFRNQINDKNYYIAGYHLKKQNSYSGEIILTEKT